MGSKGTRIALWGGVECTVNRVGDAYRDQIQMSGHDVRADDLDRFARLGIKALRYPVLWERASPGATPDWTWSDERLDGLRRLGIAPIVGLVHHGSGPRHTHLLDESFASGLGRFAGEVAARYPWVEAWTPVNEPLTTARFAALYGHWYPHVTDERAFWLALLNQVDATRAAMKAIRRANPAAKLVQTDDLGRTYATDELADQAAHDNLRRWASWDLLFGHVDRSHPLSDRLGRFGFADRLRIIADDPCPPDVIGLNHYLTSDRYLDHRLDRYPQHLHGGNCRMRYADTEALRALPEQPAGLAGAIREAWTRYHTPIALTEVHNGCTREEQLRWAAQAWDTAHLAEAEGIAVVAVTAWSLLGSHGWDTLLRAEGRYEPGVFDVASGTPRETALATLWRGLPAGAARHPVAREPGWWQRRERLIYADPASSAAPDPAPPSGHPLIVCGPDSGLRQAVLRICAARGIDHVVAEDGWRAWFRARDAPRPPSRAIVPWAVLCTHAGPRACHCTLSAIRAPRTGPGSGTPTAAYPMEAVPFLRLSDEAAASMTSSACIHAALDRLIDETAPGHGNSPAAV